MGGQKYDEHGDAGWNRDGWEQAVRRQAADLASDLHITMVNKHGELVVTTGKLQEEIGSVEVENTFYYVRIHFRPMQIYGGEVKVYIQIVDGYITVFCSIECDDHDNVNVWE